MKVLFDHQAFTGWRYSGVSKSFYELIGHLPKDVEYEVSIEQSNNIYLQSSCFVPNLKPAKFDNQYFTTHHYFPGIGTIYKFLSKYGIIQSESYCNTRASIKALDENNYDVFHPTFFNPYFLKYLKKPFVLTIHDMMPELFPQYFKHDDSQIIAKKILVNKAAAIVAISEKTKADVVDILKVDPKRITVIHHGGPVREEINDASLFPAPYFLYVGVRDRYKNFKQTLRDFAQFATTHRDILLVCTGPDFNSEELSMIKQLNIQDSVKHITASEHQMKVLFSNAIAFIYPSLYEGFGMPILEAMAYGCPVLLNNKSCFPEIGGNAAIYFDSTDNVSDLPEKMEHVYSVSAKERISIIEKGYCQLARFSWEKSSRQLADVYKSVAETW